MSLRRKGFTLVELLIVIGIIAVLIAILLPTIAGARRQANLLKCASNVRQIVTGCLLRAQDSKGYLPLAGEIVLPFSARSGGYAVGLNDSRKTKYVYANAPGVSGEMPVPFPAAIAPYLGYGKQLNYNDWDRLDQDLNAADGIWKMFICPATDSYANARRTNDPNDTTLVNQGTMMAIKYGFIGSKAVAAWSTNSDYGLNEGVFGFNWEPGYQEGRLAGKMSSIRSPAQTMLVSDAKRRDVRAYNFMPDGWICWTPTLSPRASIPMGDLFKHTLERKSEAFQMLDMSRHKGRINIGFADGHVATLNITQADLNNAYFLVK